MSTLSFSPFDWVIVSVILISAVLSLFRGFVKEILSLAGFVLALILAIRFQYQVADLITFTESPVSKQVVGFFSIFIGTLVLCSIAATLVQKLIHSVGLSPLDRLLGMAFGALRGALMVLVAILFLPEVIAIDQEQFWKESSLVPHFLQLQDWAYKTFGEVKEISEQLIGIGI